VPPVGPSKIGKYDVEERIGEGAMGVVYRAVDPVLKRRVAIKVMSDAFAQNDDLRERFVREAQAAGSLQHPNVITIYDFGDVDGHLYIAMEFVEGYDMTDLLERKVSLTTTQKLDLAIGVLQGLAFAHRRGIVHRDVKPANIRIDADGNARLMDFGVAHLASSDMTRSGVMLGTPSYMAPEQITGGKVGPQTDIFSAGAVLYELLTGTRAFGGAALQEVMYRVLSDAPKPLAEVAPDLPPELDLVLTRALAKDADARYTTALDMANDLASIRAAITASSMAATVSLRSTIETALELGRTHEMQRAHRRRIVITVGAVAAAGVLVMSGWLIARRGPAATDLSPSTTSAPATTLAGAPVAPDTSAAAARVPRRDSAAPVARSAQSPSSALPSSPPAKPPRAAVERLASPVTAAKVESTDEPPPSDPRPGASSTAMNASLPPSAPPPAVTPTVSTAATNVAAPVSRPPAPATPTSTANASAEIEAVLDAYAHAIESRDMTQLRRAYASITADQSRAFSDFFASTRTLHASLSTRGVHVDGNSATASVSGVYEFTTNTGREQTQSVNFTVELRRDGGAWRLVAVR
jgi:serine/threonine-protein kinase